MKKLFTLLLLPILFSCSALAQQGSGFDWYSDGKKVHFFAQDTTYVHYAWEFGDIFAGTGTGKTPVYTYLASNGYYEVVLTVTDSNSNKTVYKNMVGTGDKENSTIPDTVPPVLKFYGDSFVTLAVHGYFSDPGIMVIDDRSQVSNQWDTSGTFYESFPDKKAVHLGLYTIVYIGTDGAGNKDSITRYINVVDTIPPTVNVLSPILTCINEGEVYVEPDLGADVFDNYWPKDSLSLSNLICETSPTPETPGIYKLYGFVSSDPSGNESHITWRYLVIWPAGYTGPCVLQDSLKDTCSKVGFTALPELQRIEGVQVYPNPASDIVNIRFNELPGLNTNIRVVDISGKSIVETGLNDGLRSGKYELNISTLPEGMYFIEISTPDGVLTKKISITR